MKAAVCTGYGSPDLVRIMDVEKPVPKDDEVLIKVRAASVNPLDWHIINGKPYISRVFLGLSKPRFARVGRDVAGEVEKIGKRVTQFKPGDEVFGVCRGAFAEFACASESKLAIKPDNVTFEQAASAPVAGLTALQGLRDKGKVKAGQSVLVNGAAGGVGTFAVQIAKSFGADVTGVCSSRNVEMVLSIGADSVVDYTHKDFTKSGRRYDVIFDLVAAHSLSDLRSVLVPKGVYIGAGMVGTDISLMGVLVPTIEQLFVSAFASQKLVTFMAKVNKDDLATIGDLMASRKVTPVIEKRLRLSEVAQAITQVKERHARGKVIITPDVNNEH